MRPVDPVIVLDLFPEIRSHLLGILAGLSETEWNAPTVCAGWTVKDIALHLLGDDMGCLSARRDGFRRPALGAPTSPASDSHHWPSVVERLNRANQAWVEATRRLSPRLLCELLQHTGDALDAYWRRLDPYAMGNPVRWAGPHPAPVWLDIAREYTERWLHQQHIRDALGRPGLKERRYLAPVIATFVHALPHTYRPVDAPETTAVKLVVTGEAGGEWAVLRQTGKWALYRDVETPCQAAVTMDQDTAWRLFSRGIGPGEAKARSTVTGDQGLAETVFETVAIIA
jgi:uncharacterized protein (TIGR03083 family)